MSMLDKLKERFGGAKQRFEYECTKCGHVFESPHVQMNKVRCPECLAGKVKMADRA